MAIFPLEQDALIVFLSVMDASTVIRVVRHAMIAIQQTIYHYLVTNAYVQMDFIQPLPTNIVNHVPMSIFNALLVPIYHQFYNVFNVQLVTMLLELIAYLAVI